MVNPSTLKAEFRSCLVTLDVRKAKRLWAHMRPDLPQPKNDEEVLVMLHHARTQVPTIKDEKRVYSHQWLKERNLPSALPDKLLPLHARMYPQIAEGVMVSVNFRSEIMKPASKLVEGVMSAAVMEAYADKKTDPEFVRARMTEARKKETKRLFG